MTDLNKIMELMLPKIPLDMRTDDMIDIELARIGVIDMASALDFPTLTINESIEEVVDENTGDVKSVVSYSLEETLDFRQMRLAAYYAYGAYLQRLKLSFTNDAINFSTLTFAIKGLEKRPDAINDSIYMWNRYLPDEIAKARGASVVIGIVQQLGGDTND